MTDKPKFPTIAEIAAELRAFKPYIDDDYRADPEDTVPSMSITLGWTPESGNWAMQSGDNSYSGAAYGHPIWAVDTLTRRANSRTMARGLIEQLADQFYV